MTARRAARSGAGLFAAVALACPAQASPSADERAARMVASMTQEEKLQAVFGLSLIHI